jgi:hypothetical protein
MNRAKMQSLVQINDPEIPDRSNTGRLQNILFL